MGVIAPPTETQLSGLRELNALSVVMAMRGNRQMTVTELAGLTGLSRPSVDVIAHGLVDDGWAVVVEPDGSSVVGRPARRYGFNAGIGFAIGVDIGVHKVLVLLADLEGTPVRTARVPVAADAEPDVRLAVVDAVIDDELGAAGVTFDQVWAVTVGAGRAPRPALLLPRPGRERLQARGAGRALAGRGYRRRRHRLPARRDTDGGRPDHRRQAAPGVRRRGRGNRCAEGCAVG